MRRADPRSEADGQSGFALLEALVAFAILVLVVSVMFSVLGSAQQMSRKARLDQQLVSRAETLLNRVGLDLPLKPGETRGSFEDGMVWSLVIGPYREDGRPTRLMSVDVTVFGREPKDTYRLTTLKRGEPS